jgi:hydroxymethylbilane synthase
VTGRVRVGTRWSPLARAQTGIVLAALVRADPDTQFEAVGFATSGDRDRTLGGSPDFTDAIDRALAQGDVDLAVHSAKDLPVVLDRRFDLAACPPRADPRDCLVVDPEFRRRAIPRGARVGSSSQRRRAQLLRSRPDLEVVEVRGNVDTRIELVRRRKVDAVILAAAGIARLGRSAEIDRYLPTTTFLPAPAQGALAVVARTEDAALRAITGRVDHAPSRARIEAERAVAAALGGDCRLPFGALATMRSGTLSLSAEVLSPDGRTSLRRQRRGPVAAAAQLGAALGRELLDRGATELLGRSRG